MDTHLENTAVPTAGPTIDPAIDPAAGPTSGPTPGRIWLYLARHGETVWNTESRMQGRGNSALTARGRADARRLADTLADIPLLAAFTSPAPRARETTALALAGRPVPLVVDERIQEMDLGRFEGLTVAEAYALDPENMDAFFHHAERFVPRGGESFADVLERIAHFLAELTADPQTLAGRPSAGLAPVPADDRHMLIVSHNITVKAMLTLMRHRPLERLREGTHIPQATLIPVVFDPRTGEYHLLPEAERIVP